MNYCLRCNGQAVKNYDEFFCLQCGREFDSTGKELVPIVGSGKPTSASVGRHQRQDKYRYKVIHRENWGK